MPSEWRARAERCKRDVPIEKLCSVLGIHVAFSASSKGRQVRCPIHGKDENPSARIYFDTNDFHCFFCHESYDVIGLVQACLELKFPQAIEFLEEKFQLTAELVPVEESFQDRYRREVSGSSSSVGEEGGYTEGAREELQRLDGEVRKYRGKVSFDDYQKVCWLLERLYHKGIDPVQERQALLKIDEKVKGWGSITVQGEHRA